MNTAAIVLAAGRGTRMQSDLPKVLHEINGKPLLQWVVDSLHKLNIHEICVVIGGDLDLFGAFLKQNANISICQQLARQGTADAVAATHEFFLPRVKPGYARGQLLRGTPSKAKWVLICVGDVPGVSAETLQAFMQASQDYGAKLSVLGMNHPQPTGYGRLICDAKGKLLRIVEEKNANTEERKISLCNTGIVFADVDFLFECLAKVSPNSLTREYYLTDCFEIAQQKGETVYAHPVNNYREFEGVNDQEQLRRLANWMSKEKGV